MCARQPEQAHGHDCEVSGQCNFTLNLASHRPNVVAYYNSACMSVWMLCFHSRLSAINLECNIQVLTHSPHPHRALSGFKLFSFEWIRQRDIWKPCPLPAILSPRLTYMNSHGLQLFHEQKACVRNDLTYQIVKTWTLNDYQNE